jgi:hypothetical protein
MIDVRSDCPSTGEIYHVNSYQCDTVCPVGFYPNNTDYYCYKCHNRCYQCTGPLINQCTNCHTTIQHRRLNGTLCVCQLLYYYDNIVSDICPDCSHTCLTCNFSSTSSCLSCNLTDNRYDDGNFSCPCNPGWYDHGGRTCAKCDVTCATCFGGAWNNCITCPSYATSFRNISSNQCNCIIGYYHSGVATCSKCIYSCRTCQTTPTYCTTC